MSSLDSLLNIHYTVDGMKKDEICFSLNKQLSPSLVKEGYLIMKKNMLSY